MFLNLSTLQNFLTSYESAFHVINRRPTYVAPRWLSGQISFHCCHCPYLNQILLLVVFSCRVSHVLIGHLLIDWYLADSTPEYTLNLPFLRLYWNHTLIYSQADILLMLCNTCCLFSFPWTPNFEFEKIKKKKKKNQSI